MLAGLYPASTYPAGLTVFRVAAIDITTCYAVRVEPFDTSITVAAFETAVQVPAFDTHVTVTACDFSVTAVCGSC